MAELPAHPEFDPAAVTDLDVRDDLRGAREPLARILIAANTLPDGGVLHLRTTFLPSPLLELLGQKGFSHHSESYATDDWSTWFWKGTLVASDRGDAIHDHDPLDDGRDEVSGIVDVRAYPPPEPLTYILERVEVDPDAFDVLLPFFPSPLVQLLEPTGRSVELVAEAGDGVHVRITARPSSPWRP